MYYDAIEFVNLLVEARRTDDRETQFNAWTRAVELYKGPFLDKHTERWIVERRDEYRDGYIEALVNLADYQREQGDHEQALLILQKALETNNMHIGIHMRIMQIYSDLSRRSEIAAHFKQMQEIYRQEDHHLPEEVESQYKKLMA